MLLSIVIPAYNEEKRLGDTLEKIETFLTKKSLEAEIIIVIEKSEDKTLELVKFYKDKYKNIRYFENDKKYGKGYSIKKGVMAANGDYILFSDADLSTPIEELLKMFDFMLKDKCDCCIGERVQIKKQPWYRIILGKGFRLISYLVADLSFTDTQCGFKLFTRRFGQTVFPNLQTNGFAFDIEMLMIALKLNFDIKSIKVDWFNDEASTVNPLIDPIIMLKDLLKIKYMVNKNMAKEFKKSGNIGIYNNEAITNYNGVRP